MRHIDRQLQALISDARNSFFSFISATELFRGAECDGKRSEIKMLKAHIDDQTMRVAKAMVALHLYIDSHHCVDRSIKDGSREG